MATATALAPTAPRRDPAWWGRVFWGSAALVVLWPLAVATEFKPWVMFDARSLEVTGRFLRDFWPPAHEPSFLWMVLRESWRTVAIPTPRLTLPLLLAVPVGSVEGLASCAIDADDVVCPFVPPHFQSVGSHYADLRPSAS